MTCELNMYLKGVYYLSKEVLLHDNSYDLTEEDNCTIREIELDAHVQKFRIENIRQIIKSQYECQVVIIFQSKINKYEPE